MGGCSSKITPISTLPPHTDTNSRATSIDYDHLFEYMKKKDKLAGLIKSEFDTYKRNVRSIEVAVEAAETKYLLTEFFYDSQEKTKARLRIMFEAMKDYDYTFAKVYEKKFAEFEKAYRGYILYLYTSDKLVLAKTLENREDVLTFFGIRRRVVSFSKKPALVIIHTDKYGEN